MVGRMPPWSSGPRVPVRSFRPGCSITVPSAGKQSSCRNGPSTWTGTVFGISGSAKRAAISSRRWSYFPTASIRLPHAFYVTQGEPPVTAGGSAVQQASDFDSAARSDAPEIGANSALSAAAARCGRGSVSLDKRAIRAKRKPRESPTPPSPRSQHASLPATATRLRTGPRTGA